MYVLPYSEVDSLSLKEAKSLSLTNSLLSSYLMNTINTVLTENYVAPLSWVGGRPPTLIMQRGTLLRLTRNLPVLIILLSKHTVTGRRGQTHTNVTSLTVLRPLLFTKKKGLTSFAFQRKFYIFQFRFGLQNTTSDIVSQKSTETL